MWTLCADKHYGILRRWYPFVHQVENKGIKTIEGLVKEVCVYANSLVDRKVSANESYELLYADSNLCEIKINGEVPEFHYALHYMLELVIASVSIPAIKGCNVEVFKFLNIKVFASHVVIFKIENNRVVPVYTFRIIGGRPSSESWVTDIPNNHYGTRGKLAKERLKGVDLSGNPIQKFAKFIKAMDNSGDRIRIEFQNNKLLIYTSSHDFIKNYLEVFTELTERSKQVYVLTKYKKKKYLISFEGTESFGVYEYEIRSIKNGMLLTK